MELLIGLAIFSTATLIITNIFVTATRTQRQVTAGQKVQADIRLAVERMTRDIRQSSIDYTFYQGLITNNPQTILVLEDLDSNQIRYRQRQLADRGTLEMCINGDCGLETDWAPLVSSSVDIVKANFYLWPSKDPLQRDEQGNYMAHQQPLVTLAIQAKGAGAGSEEQESLVIQTTVSSRFYRR